MCSRRHSAQPVSNIVAMMSVIFEAAPTGLFSARVIYTRSRPAEVTGTALATPAAVKGRWFDDSMESLPLAMPELTPALAAADRTTAPLLGLEPDDARGATAA